MSFKTSVLIWFSRSCGTASPPAPLYRGGAPNGVRLLYKMEEHGLKQSKQVWNTG